MKKNQVLLMLPVLFLATVFFGASSVSAADLEGVNADEIEVKVFAKQGDEWFRARYMKTDDDGVLEIENVLPGKYKVVVKDEDQKDTQVLATKFKMLDNNGVQIDESTDVKVYIYLNDVKTYLGTWQTNGEGWVSLSALYPEKEYILEVSDDMSLKSRADKYRVKVSAKIDSSNWFRGYYARTDAEKILKVKNVLPGSYKFKFNKDDATLADTFVLKIKMLNNDAEEISKKTAVNVYVYIAKTKTLIGTLETDNEGWITLPGVLTNMKYRLEIK